MMYARFALTLGLTLLILPIGAGAQELFDPGVKVGEMAPGFRLPDQDGVMQEFDSLKGANGLAVLFFRSADWCPFCKTALVQLEVARPGYDSQGLKVVGISYDSINILKTFEQRVGIGYRMLSDNGSKIISDFGILNSDVPADNPQYGIPHPGMFILDADGRVVSKYFEQNFRERFTPATVLTREYGDADGQETEIRTEHFTMTARLSQDLAARGNRISILLAIDLPDRMHLYAPGVEGYRPVALNIDSHPAVTLRPTEFPESEVLYLEAIDERVPVYHDTVRLTRDFVLGDTTDAQIELTGSLAYQACNDEICFLPTEVPVSFTLNVGSLDRVGVTEN